MTQASARVRWGRASLIAGLLLGTALLAACRPWRSIELPLADAAEVLRHTGFSLKYSEAYEQAEWVAYELTAEETQGGWGRADDFRTDPAVPTGSALPEDYRGSGYDRGHLVPAGDMKWSPAAMSDSFLMSNMSPQNPSFNRGIWRTLEEKVRDWAEQNEGLYVVTGPVLADGPFPTIGANGVAVPRRFYKVLLDYREPELKAIGFVLPNEGTRLPLGAFALSVDEVEAITGLDFFAALPDPLEELLESRCDLSLWERPN
jgi:endonuclease G